MIEVPVAPIIIPMLLGQCTRGSTKSGAGVRPGNGVEARETSPLPLFSIDRTKCVLESPSQFEKTAVSHSSHLDKTRSAFAAYGLGRGLSAGTPSLLHKLLFPERVMQERNGYIFP